MCLKEVLEASIQLQMRSKIGKYYSSLRGVIPSMAISRNAWHCYITIIARTDPYTSWQRIGKFGFAAADCILASYWWQTFFPIYSWGRSSPLSTCRRKKKITYPTYPANGTLLTFSYCILLLKKGPILSLSVWPLCDCAFGNAGTPYQSLPKY